MSCRVCQMPTHSIHFKTLTCRACAAFFRRSVSQKLTYKCTKTGTCDVNKDTRASCRSCRMEKCISVGMNDEGAWRSKDGSPDDDHLQKDTSDLESDEQPLGGYFYSMQNILSDTQTFYANLWERIHSTLGKEVDISVYSSGKSLGNQVLEGYAQLMKRWPNFENDTLKPAGKVKLSVMFCEYFQVMEQAAEFCMKISHFVDLPIDQRRLVYRNFISHFPQMFRILSNVDWLGHDVTDSTVLTHSGIPFDYRKDVIYDTVKDEVSKKEMEKIVLTSTAYAHKLFYRPYKRLFADNFERAFLMARRIWLLEGIEGISEDTLQTASVILASLSEELHLYYVQKNNLCNYASRLYKINNLLISLDRIDKVRRKNRAILHMFEILKLSHYEWHVKDVN